MLSRWLLAFVLCCSLHADWAAVERKNFPILSDPEFRVAVASIRKPSPGYRWSDEEIAAVSDELRKLSSKAKLEQRLRVSRTYGRYADHVLVRAWADAAKGINNIIDVYETGKKPRYPLIDSPSFDVKSENYRRLLQIVTAVMEEEKTTLFFEPSLRYAMRLLEINKRDEAGRHEPLELGENRAAITRIKKIDWSKYPYTVIVVPGAGTDRLTWSMSPWGSLRAEIAARRYKQGKAAFILVSGGYVHPAQTPYAEAIEMKKALIADYGVPADAILIDPHARHTTTNMRNAVRQIFRYGIPTNKPALVTTDQFQSRYIEAPDFVKRCQDEMGHVPYKDLRRVSPFDLELIPVADALQADPSDPLDP